ncbi:glycosyl hydrolase family 16 [Glaciihabitans tibetensis]|uniref:Glycosyl hydrolase family 16 n=1 Tax=Glaciihabitans tibetensis TaxID=1266600 RepID=A0A2T0V2A1_9MICO|nr:glycoside hydrolase family 16 protein [Glaciihabitans tibetensis]PRY64306.1 glycosyl hydrolase family 16 [Glaciihabitans tibetensis]
MILDFADDFSGPALDAQRWVDHYLPQWSTPERSRARYDFDEGGLRLRIDVDQATWPDETGQLRVSNIQTGSFSGERGSDRGTHRSDPGLRVRTPVETRRLWTPSAGADDARRVDVTLRATAHPACMVAVWLVGFEEDSPADSGEICIAELFGSAITADSARVNVGVKAHHDPRLRDEMAVTTLACDVTQEHSYGGEWGPDRVRFFVDEQLIHTVNQGLSYPVQLMVDLFEFPDETRRSRDPADYPKTAHVRGVRGYRRAR